MKNDDKKTDQPRGTELELKKTGNALATVDFGEDAGQGLEGVTAAELRIPFIIQLQPLSPQVKPVTAGGMPGAKPGMLLNAGTGELYDINEVPLTFLPVYRDHKFLEFTPRNLGGGFVAMYEPDDALVVKLRGEQSKFGRLVHNNTKGRNEKGELLDGTEIIESFSLFGIFDPFGTTPFRGVVPFKSTQIKKYQNFMGRVTGLKYNNAQGVPVTPPMWAHAWDLKAGFESNKQGEFYGLNLSLHGKKPDGTEDAAIKSLVARSEPIYQEAKAFYEMLREGVAKADMQTATADQEVPKDDGPPM